MHKSRSEILWTVIDLLTWTTSHFQSHNIESPRLDAEILLADALGIRRIDLYLRHDQPVETAERARFKERIRKRTAGMPVAYITGKKAFWTRELIVTPDVLIPRPETECLLEAALRKIPFPGEGFNVLEAGTGSGALAVSLAGERPGATVFAADKSTAAVGIALKNAEIAGLRDRIRFFTGDWVTAVRVINAGVAGLDLIMANPPYVKTGRIADLQPEIRAYEPLIALNGGTDGLFDIRRLIDQAALRLRPGGHLLLEIGSDQGEAAEETARRRGYVEVAILPDYAGLDRVLTARYPG
jgi:release factor glutamine methyltransferase